MTWAAEDLHSFGEVEIASSRQSEHLHDVDVIWESWLPVQKCAVPSCHLSFNVERNTCSEAELTCSRGRRTCVCRFYFGRAQLVLFRSGTNFNNESGAFSVGKGLVHTAVWHPQFLSTIFINVAEIIGCRGLLCWNLTVARNSRAAILASSGSAEQLRYSISLLKNKIRYEMPTAWKLELEAVHLNLLTSIVRERHILLVIIYTYIESGTSFKQFNRRNYFESEVVAPFRSFFTLKCIHRTGYWHL